MGREMLMQVIHKLDEQVDRLNVDAGRGVAKEFGDYKFACGVIRGLMLAKNEIVDILAREAAADD